MTELLPLLKAIFILLAIGVTVLIIIMAKVDQIRTRIFGHNPDKP